MSDIDDAHQWIAELQSCSSLQHGRHIDTMPVESQPPRNTNPLISISIRPSYQEIQNLEDWIITHQPTLKLINSDD